MAQSNEILAVPTRGIAGGSIREVDPADTLGSGNPLRVVAPVPGDQS